MRCVRLRRVRQDSTLLLAEQEPEPDQARLKRIREQDLTASAFSGDLHFARSHPERSYPGHPLRLGLALIHVLHIALSRICGLDARGN